jgi:hypothetical protein
VAFRGETCRQQRPGRAAADNGDISLTHTEGQPCGGAMCAMYGP